FGNEPHLELAHDALILGWDRLHKWVRHDAPLIADLQRLTPDAEDWAASPKEKAGLLWDDAGRQAIIKRLMVSEAPGMNRIESDFSRASVRKARRNRAVRTTVATLLILLTVGALIAAKVARDRSRIALSRQLAAQSVQYANDRPDLALLLSLQAHKAS